MVSTLFSMKKKVLTLVAMVLFLQMTFWLYI